MEHCFGSEDYKKDVQRVFDNPAYSSTSSRAKLLYDGSQEKYLIAELEEDLEKFESIFKHNNNAGHRATWLSYLDAK